LTFLYLVCAFAWGAWDQHGRELSWKMQFFGP
jgi:hypothetical protein